MSDIIHWREPLWLFLLLLPLLLWSWRARRHVRDTRIDNYADAHLLPLLIRRHDKPTWQRVVFACAWLLATIAMAGPALIDGNDGQTRPARDIAVIVDISPSMGANDISPSRLQRAKWKVARLLEQRAQDRFSLIIFSANAYIALPLTYDKTALRHFTDTLDIELVRRKGSNLNRALELAERTLADSQPQSRAIVLISDGETHNVAPLTLAQHFGSQSLPIYALGIGTLNGAPVKNSQGNFLFEQGQPVISKLHRDTLHTLATSSGGAYVELSTDDSDIAQLNTHIDRLPSLNRYETDSRYTQPLFTWFVSASLALFALLLIKRAPVLSILLALPLFATSPTSHAASAAQEALTALQRGDYAEAEQLYQAMGEDFNAYLGLGSIAYRQRQWQQASAWFQRALDQASDEQERAKAAYNLGNSYAQNAQLNDAVAAYQAALRWQPGHPRAGLNLARVNAALAEQHALANQNNTANATQTGEQAQRFSDEYSADAPQPQAQETALDGQVEKLNAQAPAGSLLDNYQENAHDFLQRRFSKQDRTDELNRIEDKPW